MTFDELVAEVLINTKRPDLLDRIQSAVRAATQKAHHSDFYYQDLQEVPVQFEFPAYLQNFLPTDVLPTFRKAKYLRIWQGDGDGVPGKFIQPIQIENSIDSYDYLRADVFYMAGTLLQIRTLQPVHRILFGAYVHPVVAPAENYSSWIAANYPYVIIYEATRAILRSIGFQEEAAAYERLFAEVLSELRMSCIDDLPAT